MTDPVYLIVAPLVGSFVMLAGKVIPRLSPVRYLSPLPFLAMGWVLAQTYRRVASGATIAHALGGHPQPLGIGLFLDGTAWVSVALVTTITLFVVIFALSGNRYPPAFFFYIHVLTAGMVGVALTGDIFTLFVSFEIVALCAYVLIAWEKTSQGLLAGLKYLFLSTTGILFFLIGVYLIYRRFGTLALSEVSAAVAQWGGLPAPGGGLGAVATTVERSTYLAVAMLVAGVGVRTAFIPFHSWLPEAHAYAPHPVSALLSGVLIKVSFFAMVRIIGVFQADYLYEPLLWIGAITALVAVVQALSQTDAKRLLAYHSISQMGYVLAAFSAGVATAAAASYTHAINHALFKSLLFLSVGSVVAIAGERDIFRLRPIGRVAPLVAAAVIIGSLGIAGIPPFNGYGSKHLISYTLKRHPAYPLLWAAAAGTIASFIKLSRITRRTKRPAEATPPADVPTAPGPAEVARMKPAIGVLASISLVFLSILVLASGIASRWWAARIGELVSSQEIVLPNPFTGSALLGSLPLIGVGIAVYAGIMTKPGKRVTHRIRSFAPILRIVLVFFVLGLALFSLLPWIAPG